GCVAGAPAESRESRTLSSLFYLSSLIYSRDIDNKVKATGFHSHYSQHELHLQGTARLEGEREAYHDAVLCRLVGKRHARDDLAAKVSEENHDRAAHKAEP